MVAPSKFAHVVYATHRFDEMIDWYLGVFEAKVQHRDQELAFLTYDEEHHRFAFINLGLAPEAETTHRRQAVGVHHLAYTWDDLAGLVDVYMRLRELEVRPFFSVRHGPTLSMYYADPDGNQLEFQIDLLDADSANAFMSSDAFAANPIGEPFDPDELALRLTSGAPVDDLIFRSDQTLVG